MSRQTADNLRTSVQFRDVETKSGKRAFEAWCAVWTMPGGRDVFIGAPTLDLLERAWKNITSTAFNREVVNHVWLVKAEEKKDGKV